MTYSLWRGTECLGEVVAELPSDQAVVFGLFRPSPAFADIGHLMQTRLPIEGQPVHLTRFGASTGPGPTPLRRMSPEEAAGLPPEAQLVLRDGDGDVVRADMISLMSDNIPAGHGPFPDLCRLHGVRDVAWLLGAHRLPEQKAE